MRSVTCDYNDVFVEMSHSGEKPPERRKKSKLTMITTTIQFVPQLSLCRFVPMKRPVLVAKSIKHIDRYSSRGSTKADHTLSKLVLYFRNLYNSSRTHLFDLELN